MPTPLPPETIANLRRQYPRLREDYFDYLAAVGWGETDSGATIYSGPIKPDEIYGPRDEHAGLALLGDDLQGYCFGYNTETECYGEISDDGHWKPWPQTQGILHYVTEPEDDAKVLVRRRRHSPMKRSLGTGAVVFMTLAVFLIAVYAYSISPGSGYPGGMPRMEVEEAWRQTAAWRQTYEAALTAQAGARFELAIAAPLRLAGAVVAVLAAVGLLARAFRCGTGDGLAAELVAVFAGLLLVQPSGWLAGSAAAVVVTALVAQAFGRSPRVPPRDDKHAEPSDATERSTAG